MKWQPHEVETLRERLSKGDGVRDIVPLLERSASSITSKAASLGLLLPPAALSEQVYAHRKFVEANLAAARAFRERMRTERG